MIILFEKYSKYKLGDLVLLKFDPNILNPWTYPIGKVVGFGDDGVKLRLKTYPSDSKITKFFVFPYEIQRKLKKDEIEKLKIKIKTIKYNI